MIIHNPSIRRLLRVRAKIKTNLTLPRLSVFRSHRHIWAQIIDDLKAKTLASTSTKALKLTKGTKIEQATEVGKAIATLALDNHIKEVRFDRGLYKYHGRVKALAQSARQQGLKF